MSKQLKKLFLFISLFVLAIAFNACDKNQPNVLPEASTSGKNVFGCKIDGRIFKTKGRGYSPGVSAYYQHIYPSDSGYYFQVRGLYADSYIEQVHINIDSVVIVTNKIFTLGDPKLTKFVGGYDTNKDGRREELQTDNIRSGEIFFTKFDPINRIASGTFWFDVITSDSTIIEIRNGIFDVTFTL